MESSLTIPEESQLQGGPEMPAPKHPFFQSEEFGAELNQLRSGLENLVNRIYDSENMSGDEFSSAVSKLSEGMFKEGMSQDDRNYVGVLTAAMTNFVRQVEAAKRENALESSKILNQDRAGELRKLHIHKEKLLSNMGNWWKEFVEQHSLTPNRPPYWVVNLEPKGLAIDVSI